MSMLALFPTTKNFDEYLSAHHRWAKAKSVERFQSTSPAVKRTIIFWYGFNKKINLDKDKWPANSRRVYRIACDRCRKFGVYLELGNKRTYTRDFVTSKNLCSVWCCPMQAETCDVTKWFRLTSSRFSTYELNAFSMQWKNVHRKNRIGLICGFFHLTQ